MPSMRPFWRAETEARSKEWALAGLVTLVDHLIRKLADSDPLIRQEAAIAIGNNCPKNHPAVSLMIGRLQSSDLTHHDRACAASALGQIGAKVDEVIPILLRLIEEMKDHAEADEFRRYAAKAIEKLMGDLDRV